ELRQQWKAAAITADERFAEQRVGVDGQQCRQRDRRAVGELEHARMQPRLVVGVVSRDLERLTVLATRRAREALERAKPVATPRPLDEIVALRLQKAGCEIRGDAAVALEQTIGNSAVGRHSSRPTRG